MIFLFYSSTQGKFNFINIYNKREVKQSRHSRVDLVARGVGDPAPDVVSMGELYPLLLYLVQLGWGRECLPHQCLRHVVEQPQRS